jgi:hypothetical protein
MLHSRQILQGLTLCQAANYQLMLRSAPVAQAAKPADEALPRLA